MKTLREDGLLLHIEEDGSMWMRLRRIVISDGGFINERGINIMGEQTFSVTLMECAIAIALKGYVEKNVGPDYHGNNEGSILVPNSEASFSFPPSGKVKYNYMVPAYSSDHTLFYEVMRLARDICKVDVNKCIDECGSLEGRAELQYDIACHMFEYIRKFFPSSALSSLAEKLSD